MAGEVDNFDAWDPLESTAGADPGILISAQRREITNILRSYTGYYDLFSEILQNALDAIEKRLEEGAKNYDPKITISIDLKDNTVEITDNGCSMDLEQLKQFLRPNFSFKSGGASRGSKGVGATYLGYGFNYLRISTRYGDQSRSGVIENGRRWVEDKTGTVPRPKVTPQMLPTGPFSDIDRGVSILLQLKGENVRPRDLRWYQATTANQWLSLLRINTPLGGIYINNSKAPKISIQVTVRDQEGNETKDTLGEPEYYYPNQIVARSGSLVEFLKQQTAKVKAGVDPSKIPPRFSKLNGLWGHWSNEELLGEHGDAYCPIKPRLSPEEKSLAVDSGVSIYVYLAFSTELWDNINDKILKLRKGQRVLHGGLQLATRNMPKGQTLTIPMTNNVGFQNLAHILIHFERAEPDLGRKGFQPEYVALAEKFAVSAVTAFRQRYNLLRKPGATKVFDDEVKIETWIRQQERHEVDHSLIISGKGLFMPTEELPIRSEPIVEQDVVALFNQMLSSGLIRGIQLIASSQYNQYDGLYRVRMDPPFDKYVLSDNNPLGVVEDFFDRDDPYVSTVKVLEYKYNLDGLMEELNGEIKDTNDIGLVVAWEMGVKWAERYDVTCLLDPDTVHYRQIHGATHLFVHSVSGAQAFMAIILKDLVAFLRDSKTEVARQRSLLDSVDSEE